jgi:hypothetical protein
MACYQFIVKSCEGEGCCARIGLTITEILRCCGPWIPCTECGKYYCNECWAKMVHVAVVCPRRPTLFMRCVHCLTIEEYLYQVD